MYQEFFSKSPLLAFPLVALALFIGVFLMITWRAMSSKNRAAYEAMSQLPLDAAEAEAHDVE